MKIRSHAPSARVLNRPRLRDTASGRLGRSSSRRARTRPRTSSSSPDDPVFRGLVEAGDLSVEGTPGGAEKDVLAAERAEIRRQREEIERRRAELDRRA